MADAKSDYLERKVLDHALGTTAFTKPTAVYIALFTSDPTDTGSAGVEASGGSYARKAITFDPATTDGSTGISSALNNNTLSWTNMPAGTYTHIGIFDALTAGNELYHTALAAPKTLSAGDSFGQNPGQVTVREA